MTVRGEVAELVLVPALVRGRLVEPADDDRERDDVTVIRRPILDRRTLQPTGGDRVIVTPRPDPAGVLPERGAIEALTRLPFAEVLAYVESLHHNLATVGGRSFTAALDGLVDPAAMATAVERDLGTPGTPGREYLDGWVPVTTPVHAGPTSCMSQIIHDSQGDELGSWIPRLRAVPTRQLHVTAGNSPLIPVASLLWALASKGAAVVKAAVEGVAITGLLARAMAASDSTHPLTRHTSLLYWKGGDPAYDEALLAGGHFDRVIGWGSDEAIDAVARRAGQATTILFGPRVSVSMIGREVSVGSTRSTAIRAAADSMIADQAACQASLVHIVEGSEPEVLAYCEEVREAMAAWDRALPHATPIEVTGRLQRLRRGALAHGTWMENGTWPAVSSAVVYVPTTFDLRLHPGSRFVVVRRVDRLEDAVRSLHPGIASVGVAPESRRVELADRIAAAGVDRVLPLGEAELGYAGMPHDGRRVLSELVRWVTG